MPKFTVYSHVHPRQLFHLEVEVRSEGSRGKQTGPEASDRPRQRQLAVLYGARALQK